VRGVPADREIAFGNDAYQKVAADSVFVDDSNAVAQVAAIAAPLRAVVDTHGVPFHYYVIEGEPNAFALPGGHIFVTTGLLDLLDSPEELAGVLAHESAHVARRHMFQHLISGKGPIYLIQLLTGGRNQLFNLMAIPSELLVYESYSQKYEREADSYGWDYLLAAGIDPRGLSRALAKLRDYEARNGEESSRHGKAFDSHPDLDRRIAWLDAKWNALPADRRTQFTPLTTPVPKIKTEPRRSLLEKLFGR
jgi:predicted Zn-dependent protease